ncbi:MAG: transcription-repair coupling factor [Chloroflexia bacterium]|nr:transcription-repair coupling factor [Chloroflexia bacterium]
MSLSHILPRLDHLPFPGTELGNQRRRWSTPQLLAPARPAALAAFVNAQHRPVLVVAPRQETADRIAVGLNAFLPAGQTVMMWTAPDPLPYEQMPHDPVLSARRIEILGSLRSVPPQPPIIVTTTRAIAAFVRAPESFDRDSLRLKIGQRLDMQRLVRYLVSAGYEMEPLTTQPGTFSRRGGIVDVFSPGDTEGLRIEFFGDEIDSIRRFDGLTQRSTDKQREAMLLPSIEFDLSDIEAGLQRLGSLGVGELRPEVHDEWLELLQRLGEGDTPEAVDLIAVAFPGNNSTLLDYLPTETLVVHLDPESLRLQAEQMLLRADEVRRTLEQAAEIPTGFDQPFADWTQLIQDCHQFDCWEIGSGSEDPDPSLVLPVGASFAEPPVFASQIADMVETVTERVAEGWSVVFASEQSERLSDILIDADIYPRATKRGAAAIPSPPMPRTVDVMHAQLEAGFSVPQSRLLVLTDREVFGIRKAVRPPVRQRPRRPSQLSRFTLGSYVVHVEHGVGTYCGLITMATTGVDREYLQVDYAGGDRLYIPVDQSDRLSSYESPTGAPKITRLSSPDWSRSKSRVRKAVREMAFELLQVYAARETAQGHAFPVDSTWDNELSESFPYQETIDQEKAIVDVKGDMESPRPMDRLVCGDVGYGKTEVALRAAFKAVNDGWQVAILVPTTVLALQHLSTFKERLGAFPVNIEMLSRLRSRAQQRQILDGVERGEADIIIGTHRLLQSDVRFKRLGLLVVDEEQRFGVTHKEHIKRLRAEIDVLTMTATPIPRTLHLALTGIRDLSLITTPPQERVPIRTFVTARDDNVVREAILRELSRGGQVYVVHNRVQSIFGVADWLRDLVPEASLGVGHGQMDEKELERVVLSFMQHEFDVLICTTIIESGVDIQNVNTMIIDNAQQLGLTQLYQLRGRVGRGANRAYCYLLYPPHTPLSIEATERLEAIQEATELGAGFQIAMRDMEIRGVGNVLGAEQSGHIAAVGLDLYTKMLARAVDEIRAGHPIMEPEDVTIDIAIDARIPEDYIEDESVRLTMYQQIAEAKNGRTLRGILDELEDRFGTVPESVKRLVDLVGMRHRASTAGITAIVERDGDIIIRPVLGGALDQNRLRRDLGQGVRVTPNQLRLTVADLKVDRWTAVATVLQAVGAVKDEMLVH